MDWSTSPSRTEKYLELIIASLWQEISEARRGYQAFFSLRMMDQSAKAMQLVPP